MAAAAAAARNGCAVQVADNSTLVPTLQQKAAVATQQPLLVIVPFNVSLGRGLAAGAIQVRRCVACPLVMLLLSSVRSITCSTQSLRPLTRIVGNPIRS